MKSHIQQAFLSTTTDSSEDATNTCFQLLTSPGLSLYEQVVANLLTAHVAPQAVEPLKYWRQGYTGLINFCAAEYNQLGRHSKCKFLEQMRKKIVHAILLKQNFSKKHGHDFDDDSYGCSLCLSTALPADLIDLTIEISSSFRDFVLQENVNNEKDGKETATVENNNSEQDCQAGASESNMIKGKGRAMEKENQSIQPSDSDEQDILTPTSSVTYSDDSNSENGTFSQHDQSDRHFLRGASTKNYEEMPSHGTSSSNARKENEDLRGYNQVLEAIGVFGKVSSDDTTTADYLALHEECRKMKAQVEELTKVAVNDNVTHPLSSPYVSSLESQLLAERVSCQDTTIDNLKWECNQLRKDLTKIRDIQKYQSSVVLNTITKVEKTGILNALVGAPALTYLRAEREAALKRIIKSPVGKSAGKSVLSADSNDRIDADILHEQHEHETGKISLQSIRDQCDTNRNHLHAETKRNKESSTSMKEDANTSLGDGLLAATFGSQSATPTGEKSDESSYGHEKALSRQELYPKIDFLPPKLQRHIHTSTTLTTTDIYHQPRLNPLRMNPPRPQSSVDRMEKAGYSPDFRYLNGIAVPPILVPLLERKEQLNLLMEAAISDQPNAILQSMRDTNIERSSLFQQHEELLTDISKAKRAVRRHMTACLDAIPSRPSSPFKEILRESQPYSESSSGASASEEIHFFEPGLGLAIPIDDDSEIDTIGLAVFDTWFAPVPHHLLEDLPQEE